MPTPDEEFIHIGDVTKHYKTSRRTLERRRKKARDADMGAILDNFVIITSDGHTFPNPDEETFRSLAAQSRKPEWHIKKQWLDQNFDKRDDDTDATESTADQDSDATQRPRTTDDPVLDALIKELAEKNKQIAALQVTMQSMASGQEALLTLANNNPRPATDSSQQSTATTIINEAPPKPVDTTPKPQPVTQKPRPKSRPKSTPTQPKKEASKQSSAKQRSTIGRFFFGIKK